MYEPFINIVISTFLLNFGDECAILISDGT